MCKIVEINALLGLLTVKRAVLLFNRLLMAINKLFVSSSLSAHLDLKTLLRNLLSKDIL